MEYIIIIAAGAALAALLVSVIDKNDGIKNVLKTKVENQIEGDKGEGSSGNDKTPPPGNLPPPE